MQAKVNLMGEKMIIEERQKIDLIDSLAIVQGETYRELIWLVKGDKSGWTPKGEIKNNYRQDGGELLGQFQFDVPIYDPESDTTAIYPYLDSLETSAIPSTRYQGKGEITARNAYYFDFRLISPDGAVIATAPGRVEVRGEVTGV